MIRFPDLQMYYDIHMHCHIPGKGNDNIRLIENVPVEDMCNIKAGRFYSAGIHPWHINEEKLQETLDLIEKHANDPNLKAIGECGLDKLCETDFELQKRAFASQILISEKTNKPLIIHCVKSFDEIIAFKREFRPEQAWIIHGFRGKPEQAEQLIQQGFYLSFGMLYNENSIKKIPVKRLFLETDDSGCDIKELYRKAAGYLEIPEEKLIQQIEENVGKIVKI